MIRNNMLVLSQFLNEEEVLQYISLRNNLSERSETDHRVDFKFCTSQTL